MSGHGNVKEILLINDLVFFLLGRISCHEVTKWEKLHSAYFTLRLLNFLLSSVYGYIQYTDIRVTYACFRVFCIKVGISCVHVMLKVEHILLSCVVFYKMISVKKLQLLHGWFQHDVTWKHLTQCYLFQVIYIWYYRDLGAKSFELLARSQKMLPRNFFFLLYTLRRFNIFCVTSHNITSWFN